MSSEVPSPNPIEFNDAEREELRRLIRDFLSLSKVAQESKVPEHQGPLGQAQRKVALRDCACAADAIGNFIGLKCSSFFLTPTHGLRTARKYLFEQMMLEFKRIMSESPFAGDAFFLVGATHLFEMSLAGALSRFDRDKRSPLDSGERWQREKEIIYGSRRIRTIMSELFNTSEATP